LPAATTTTTTTMAFAVMEKLWPWLAKRFSSTAKGLINGKCLEQEKKMELRFAGGVAIARNFRYLHFVLQFLDCLLKDSRGLALS